MESRAQWREWLAEHASTGWARSNKEPADLAAALDADPAARAAWDGFPPSARKQLIGWVTTAKRPEKRARRVTETAARAARGERANQ